MNVQHDNFPMFALQEYEIIKRLLNAFNDASVFVDETGNIIAANEMLCVALKNTDDKLVGKHFTEFISSEYRRNIEESLRLCLQSGITKTCDADFLAEQRASFFVKLSFSPYISPFEHQKRFCVIIAQKRIDETQKELDLLRFSSIAHYTVNPLEITDVNGKIIYVNPAFEKESGFTQKEMLGKNPNIFGSGKHPKNFWKNMWETITSGKVWVGEIENKRKNGEAFFTHLLISPIINPSGNIVGYFGIHRDITEQKQLEHHLIQAQKMESVGLLAAGIAHEVGNPLTSISSLAQILLRSTDDEFFTEKLELIKNQVTRISRTIRNLVDFSRSSGHEIQSTEITKLLREAVEIVRVGKKAREILFTVKLAENIPMVK